MTLIIFLRCNDGCVLVSDRQASSQGGYALQEKKIFGSVNNQIVMAGAGDGFAVSRICLTICNEEDPDTNIREKYQTAVNQLRSHYTPPLDVDTILIQREGGPVPYAVHLLGTQIIDSRITAEFRTCGLSAARIIADHFLKKKNINELDLRTATHYAIAILQEVAKNVDGVGTIEDYGFDITAILNNGDIFEIENFRGNIAQLSTTFDIPEDVSSLFEATEEEED